MRSLLAIILRYAAKFVLWRTRPVIIGITGSVGKTSTKETVFCVVQARFRARKSEGNLNTEIGMPATILGIQPAGSNAIAWLVKIFGSLAAALLWPRWFPEVLVLEYAADKPGDIAYLTRLAPPTIGIVTTVGEIPVHVEFYAGPKSVAKEKAELIRSLPPEGAAILNFDDETVLEMKSETKAHITTFGFGDGAELRAINYELHTTRDTDGNEVPAGILFKVDHEGSVIPIRLSDTFGRPQVYAALAAVAAGIALKIPVMDAVEALAGYRAPQGRMRLLEGIKQTKILDDAYNASPTSTIAAIETLAELPVQGRKIALLGDMLEIGKYTEAGHRAVGEKAAKAVDLLFTVGDRARFIAVEAMERGMDEQNIFQFSTAEGAGRRLKDVLKPGDLVLVKGSRAMRMDKVVKEIIALHFTNHVLGL